MVDPDRDAISPGSGRPGARRGADSGVLTPVLASALLCLAAPHTLLAASSTGRGCDTVARDLKSSEIPVEMLTVDIVDHMAEDHGAMDPVIGHEHDPTAPLLFLTPRVAHILQDVFGEADTDESEATPMERVRRIMLATKAQAPQPAPKAAAAGGGNANGDTGMELDSADRIASSGPLTETFHDVDTLPRFQRRMYRNDI